MTQLTYKIPDDPESIEPYDGSVRFEPTDLVSLLKAGEIPDILFGPEALERNKGVSKLVLRAIALQSSIESQYSILLAEITKANAEIIAAMLSKIKSSHAMRETVSNAVEVSNISNNEKVVFLSLLRLSSATANTRNNFAHHLWGLVKGFEDYLLLLKPAHYASANAVIQQKHARGGIVSNEDGNKRTGYLLGKSKMYNKSHLDGLLDEQNYIYGKLKELEVLFQAPSDLKRIAFTALIYEPRILSVWKRNKKLSAFLNT